MCSSQSVPSISRQTCPDWCDRVWYWPGTGWMAVFRSRPSGAPPGAGCTVGSACAGLLPGAPGRGTHRQMRLRQGAGHVHPRATFLGVPFPSRISVIPARLQVKLRPPGGGGSGSLRHLQCAACDGVVAPQAVPPGRPGLDLTVCAVIVKGITPDYDDTVPARLIARTAALCAFPFLLPSG